MEFPPTASRRPRKPPCTLRQKRDTSAKQSWTWRRWIPNGQVTIVASPGGKGKSFSGVALLASIISGAPWPDGQPGVPEALRGSVLWLDFELMGSNTATRAEGLGVPIDMVYVQDDEEFPVLTEEANIEAIGDWVELVGARLLVIDSWRAGTPDLSENDAGGACSIGTKLVRLAQRWDIPVLVIAHTRKVQDGISYTLTIDDVRGSSALVNVARSVIVIEQPFPNDPTCRVRVVKSNFATLPPPLYYVITGTGGEEDVASFSWVSAPRIAPQEQRPGRRPRRSRPAAAPATSAQALAAALAVGPCRYAEIVAALQGTASETTIKRLLREHAEKNEAGLWQMKGSAQ